MVQQPVVDQGLIIEASRSHSHTTLSRTPLDKWSARRRNLYLTTNTTRKRQTSMLLGRFEPTIWADEQPKSHALRLRSHWNRPKVQGDSKRWTQLRTSMFPELYMVCEWSTLHLKEEVLNFQIPQLERSPSAQLCSSISWEQNGCYAAQDFFVFVSSLKLSRRLLCSVRFVFFSTFVVGITNLSK